ncbi:MAG: HNH endonuclease [Bacteroidales bacterium]|nr:HNH endonuclease [Bacteroidales bacterium]
MQTSQQPKIVCRAYATILDAYQNYLDSDLIWERYWGNSESPAKTSEQFQQEQFQSLIDRINRVPFDSEAADKGTAFNEIVDCIIEHRKSEKMEIEKVYANDQVSALKATYNEREFVFDINLVKEFSDYYKGATPQYLAKATIPTRHGDIEVYGYIDELLPDKICDIKTTGSYSFGKFKDHWQHIVYPYCLWKDSGIALPFEYNVAAIDKYGRWETYTEYYQFKAERDIPKLQQMCEDFYEFLLDNRDLIKDEKILT